LVTAPGCGEQILRAAQRRRAGAAAAGANRSVPSRTGWVGFVRARGCGSGALGTAILPAEGCGVYALPDPGAWLGARAMRRLWPGRRSGPRPQDDVRAGARRRGGGVAVANARHLGWSRGWVWGPLGRICQGDAATSATAAATPVAGFCARHVPSTACCASGLRVFAGCFVEFLDMWLIGAPAPWVEFFQNGLDIVSGGGSILACVFLTCVVVVLLPWLQRSAWR
jgi:hypothetical protein